MNLPHIPVLLNEVINLFSPINEGYFIDCTLGFGGHSEAILKQFKNIKVIGIDQDIDAIYFAKKRLTPFANRIDFINKRASEALEELKGLNIAGILADIGVSSYQLDNKNRGFNFESEVLDMRMNKNQKLSAYEVINFYSKDEIERILKDYGEVKSYKKIANFIVSNRIIKSNRELTDILRAPARILVAAEFDIGAARRIKIAQNEFMCRSLSRFMFIRRNICSELSATMIRAVL